MKPLSQSGLIRIPHNPRQRAIDPNTGTPRKRNRLAAINEVHALNNRVLHPTKGFRPISAKRSVAQMTAAEIRHGMFPFSTKAIRARLAFEGR